ncbi:MazG-like protein [Pedobacter antarcticus]|uniref:MazG-like protein n=1 Tax=Pedobacter antarcticus TaxID=34086 RepID=UPI00292D285A|nr:MazG-like protein [Pedobacter antarcticus]
MEELDFKEAIERSLKIRELYHELELQHHGSEWTIEEDALAFLTDAGLVGRQTMSQQGRWPAGKDSRKELEHKIGESMWWLIVLANRMDVDIKDVLGEFLTKTEKLLGK